MLEIGKKYTSFEIGEMMATTIKRRFIVKDIKEDKTIISFKGKRKEYYLKEPNNDTAIFESWELPFIADSDTNSFKGNALINLVGKEHEIKQFFLNFQLNPIFDKGLLVLVEGENEKMIFPKEAEDIKQNHASIKNIMSQGITKP